MISSPSQFSGVFHTHVHLTISVQLLYSILGLSYLTVLSVNSLLTPGVHWEESLPSKVNCVS